MDLMSWKVREGWPPLDKSALLSPPTQARASISKWPFRRHSTYLCRATRRQPRTHISFDSANIRADILDRAWCDPMDGNREWHIASPPKSAKNAMHRLTQYTLQVYILLMCLHLSLTQSIRAARWWSGSMRTVRTRCSNKSVPVVRYVCCVVCAEDQTSAYGQVTSATWVMWCGREFSASYVYILMFYVEPAEPYFGRAWFEENWIRMFVLNWVVGDGDRWENTALMDKNYSILILYLLSRE